MEYLTFFKICEHYYFLVPPNTIEENEEEGAAHKKRLFQESFFSKFSNNQSILATELNQILRRNVKLKSDIYIFVRSCKEEDFFLFVGLSKDSLNTPLFSRTDPKIQIAKRAIEYGKLFVCNFRLKKRKELLNRLMSSEKTKLEDCIRAFADYSFFDRYVLWIYNRHTKVFSGLVSSHELSKQYVEPKDDNSLHDFLNNPNKPLEEQRSPNRGCVNKKFAEKMKWLNRIRLQLGNHPEDVGIVDYLSEYKSFKLRSDTQCLIKSCLETKYYEHLQKSQIALHKIQQQFSIYEPGKIGEFLQDLTQKICDELCFHTCSIFKKSDSENKLEIISVKDKKQNGKLRKKVNYDIAETSFINSVYEDKDGKGWKYFYDIAVDTNNSHTHDESKESKGKTCLAFLLKWRTVKEGEKWGVLRVKNKYQHNDKEQLINFTSDDIESLQAICSHLSNIFDVETQHLEYQKKIPELQYRLKYLKNFYKVFLHEIRSPMSFFNTSALRVKALLKKLPIEERAKLPLDRKMNDIYIIGDRLSFIATTYYFHELIKPRKLEYLFLMRDIIMPVLNISVDYIRNHFGIEVLREDATLIERKIYGDMTLLGIVFNVLISNAAKYTPEAIFPIKISGQIDKDGKYFSLDVSNYGLRIHKDECEKIFMDGIRGKEAILWKSQGTGIGLYLAKSIMKNLHGNLILKSTFKPVTFAMKIPTFKWQNFKGGQND